MKKALSLILALILVLSLAACGSSGGKEDPDASAQQEETTTFIMGIDPEYPPFSYLDANGDYSGFDVEICRAACEKLGWNLEVFGVNWDDKPVQLDAGECDCIW